MRNEIMPGAVLITLNAEQSVLFGCPPEVLKHLLQSGLPLPNCVVLPGNLRAKRSSQASFEFLLYHFLFFRKGFVKQGKFRVFANAKQIPLLRDFFRMALLGPNVEEMQKLGLSAEWANQLSREINYLALTNPSNNQPYQVDEIIEWNELDRGQTATLWPKHTNRPLEIRRLGSALFEVIEGDILHNIDISVTRKQNPPYAIVHQDRHLQKNQICLTVLGASDGFDPKTAANGYLLNLGGKYVIWDCPSYLRQHLKKLKLDFNQIDAMIISHVHEDHIDVMESIREGKPLDIYCTAEIYYSLLFKICTLFNCTDKEARKFHRWHEIKTYQPTKIAGANFEFFYTIHAIPAVGCRLTCSLNQQQKIIFISGDHISIDGMQKMLAAGVITKKRFQESSNLIKGDEDFILMDAGGGTIHGNFRDYVNLKAPVKFMHTGELPEKLPPDKILVKSGDYFKLS